MGFIKSYGNYIKKNIDNPEKASKLLLKGFSLEKLAVSKFKRKDMPPSLNYLNRLCLDFIIKPMKYPEKSSIVTIFSPVELLHAMGIHPLLVEGFSSFLSGAECEDIFVDHAEKIGISDTLCSYHKAFIGAVDLEVVPKSKFVITSSMICDANLNTARHISEKYGIPYYYLDIPYEYNEYTKEYVVSQLHEIVEFMQDIMNTKFDLDKFKGVMQIENETRGYMKDFYEKLKYRYFPNTLTIEMFRLFASHLGIGRCDVRDFYKTQALDIENYPRYSGKRILWSHIMPFYSNTLKEYFNFDPEYQLVACDYNFDTDWKIDYDSPYEALADKFLKNRLNGSFDLKVKNIIDIAESFMVDGVINFCSFGCKECSGGTMLLKNALKEKGIPYLSIDGDGIDRRNAQEGQIKTRVDAFMEILRGRKVIV